MKALMRSMLSWLPMALTIVGLSLLIYATCQQEYRQSLNDPQIQLAQDAVAKLASGTSLPAVSATGTIDIARSLAPWLAVYDAAGSPLQSSGLLEGALPPIPHGVFAAAKAGMGKDTAEPHEDRVTWQTSTGIRQAIVVEYVETPSGIMYVAAGRSMREVEARESRLLSMVAGTAVVLLIATFLMTALAEPLRRIFLR